MSDLKKLLKCLEKARKPAEKHAAAEDVAEYYFTRGDYSKSLEYYEEELEAARQLQNKCKIAKAHRMIGEVKLALLEFDEALKHTKIYYNYTHDDESLVVEKQRALTTLGRTFLIKADNTKNKDSEECKRDYKLAKSWLWKSLQICQKLEEQKKVPPNEIHEMRATSLLSLALTYEGMSEWDEAAEQFNCAIRICRLKKIDNLLRNCCLGLASLYLRQKKFTAALKLYQEAFQTCRSLPEKERVPAEVEILFSESEGHMWIGDAYAARKVLQKAYKMLKKSNPHADAIVCRLKNTAAIDLLQRKILNNPEMPPEDKYKCYERLGDAFAQEGVFTFALENYEKMLEFGKIADLDLKPCYVSLSQTCKDLKMYEKAIMYYKEELLLCQSPKDACDSLMNIYECQKMLKLPVLDQLETLEKALVEANKDNNINVQRDILSDIEKVQKKAGNSFEAEDAKQKRLSLGNISSEDEEDEIQSTPDIAEVLNIDIDALSDDSDNEEEGLFESTFSAKTKRNPTRSKAVTKWKNERGETKLHRACIQGNIKAVHTLLAQGANVNAVDFAGWTPLHEAANHGHIDLVDLLLKRGADINCKGLGGVTPLYDAAEAGNFEVVEFLLDRNASVHILTDTGETILDGLIEYYNRGCSTLSAEDKEQYRCLKDRLQKLLDKEGISSKSEKQSEQGSKESRAGRKSKLSLKRTSPNNCAGKLRRYVDADIDEYPSHRKRSLRELSPVSSPKSPASVLSDDGSLDDEGEEGVSEYKSAIQNLRKVAETSVSQEPRKKITQPLLSENEVVDDWLEDDMGKEPSKKRRKSDQSVSSYSYRPLSLKRKSSSRISLNNCSPERPLSSCSVDVRENTRLSTGSRHSDVLDSSCRLSDGDESIHIEAINEFENSWSHPPDIWSNTPHSKVSQPSLLAFGVTRHHGSQVSVPSQQSIPVSQHPIPSSVNVKVEEHRLAIFIQEPTLTIGWLAEEAARRYKKLGGCLPVLDIYSLDGALYSKDDPVQMVLGADVIGQATSWSDTSIADRYKEACHLFSCDKDESISSLLEDSQATHCLDIVDMVLPTRVFKPIIKAISMERNLSIINFANNMLLDEGVADLCKNLGKLCNLTQLDLSGNNISAQGINELAKAGEKGYLKALQSLNLSHNNLGDASLSYLVTLTASTKYLRSLGLADCSFSRSIWDSYDRQYLTLSKLQSLDLSHNNLHAKGLAGFLGFSDHQEERRINPALLQNLYLIGLGGDRLCQELLLFLEHGNSVALRELHISYSSMQDEELRQLLSVLRSAPELHTLRLPAAKTLSADTVCQLLQLSSLKSLEIHNNRSIWNNSDNHRIASAVNHAASEALERLILRDPPKALAEAWRTVKGLYSATQTAAFGLQVFTTISC
ncbi:tonsoku-like protein [Thrips palmi]|uniref:Tonsoku-like protein n=1 Tax=Thrips palmi TaxID=161013 RepID=A0A6P8YSQ5_THRPL|nr:tonsoku-like protein [Thrips palmi]